MWSRQLAIALICFTLLSGIFLVNVRALGWPNLPPNPVTMNAILVESTDEWHFITTLGNVPAGYDISDGVYPGWCVDRRFMIAPAPILQVYLYSSYDLPAIPELHMQEWDLINYVLNHKMPGATTRDIQQAIWNFTTLGYQEAATRPLAIAMVNDAVANGAGFIPGPGQVMAIICYPILPGEQISIIEVLGTPTRVGGYYGIARAVSHTPYAILGRIGEPSLGICCYSLSLLAFCGVLSWARRKRE